VSQYLHYTTELSTHTRYTVQCTVEVHTSYTKIPKNKCQPYYALFEVLLGWLLAKRSAAGVSVSVLARHSSHIPQDTPSPSTKERKNGKGWPGIGTTLSLFSFPSTPGAGRPSTTASDEGIGRVMGGRGGQLAGGVCAWNGVWTLNVDMDTRCVAGSKESAVHNRIALGWVA
jgi:hypothetical protein